MARKPKHPVVDGQKPCSKCGSVLPFDAEHFVSQPDKKLGRRLLAHCKPCHSAASLSLSKTPGGREAHRIQMQRARATPEGRAAARAAGAKYRAAHREEACAKTAAWRKAHPNAAAEWRAANRPRLRVYESKQQAQRAKAPGRFTAADLAAQFNAQWGMCFYCVTPLAAMHIEHKTPLSRGGTNWPDNIVCACPSCNLRKHDRTAPEFLDIIHAEQVANDREAA